MCLYRHFNFYYCRYANFVAYVVLVYTDTLISTIVDECSCCTFILRLYRHFNFYYCRSSGLFGYYNPSIQTL